VFFFFSGHDRSNIENSESKSTSIDTPQISTCKKEQEGKFNKLIIIWINIFIKELQPSTPSVIAKESNIEQYSPLTCKYIKIKIS
jgi:hypothetical protein